MPSDFPSVTYPWLAARERSGMDICWVPDVATDDLTESIVDTISERTTAVDARRFELSTMSYSAASGLLASIELLDGIGLSSIREHSDRLAGTSSRVGGLRVSLHLYNSEDDVRALVEALESIGP